jgi:hypothetical protein
MKEGVSAARNTGPYRLAAPHSIRSAVSPPHAKLRTSTLHAQTLPLVITETGYASPPETATLHPFFVQARTDSSSLGNQVWRKHNTYAQTQRSHALSDT